MLQKMPITNNFLYGIYLSFFSKEHIEVEVEGTCDKLQKYVKVFESILRNANILKLI